MDSSRGTHDETSHRSTSNRFSPLLAPTAAAVILLVVATGFATAQTAIGDVYCGTGVETGIDLLFGALLGLGLPATILYTGKSGFDYMRAGGNIERRQAAREKLTMLGAGFGILVLALISPGLISKVGSAIGFTFSQCVQPF